MLKMFHIRKKIWSKLVVRKFFLGCLFVTGDIKVIRRLLKVGGCYICNKIILKIFGKEILQKMTNFVFESD